MLIAIIEETNGWNRKWAPFSQRQLARASGLDRANAVKGLRVLVDAGVVAQRTQGNTTSYCLRDLSPEAEWSHVASMVAQCTRKWARNAPTPGCTMHPPNRRNALQEKQSRLPKDSTRNSTKETKPRGALRRSHSPEEIADVNWAIEHWKQVHGMEPKWTKSSHIVLYQTRGRLGREFRTAWEKYLQAKDDWLRDHSPELFSKHANKWRVTGEGAAPGYRRPSGKTGQLYPIDQEG